MANKVLLYYPHTTGGNNSHALYRGVPLSVLTLAVHLDDSQYEVMVVDGRIGRNDSKLADWIDENVVCVGLSSMTSYQIRDGLMFARWVKNLNPQLPIVWGGWHPSLMPNQTIQHELVDIVAIGQGEGIFPTLVSQLAGHGDLSLVPNIAYKDKDGCVQRTRSAPFPKFSDTMPIGKGYRYVDMENYVQPLWGNQRVVGYESSRGCPWGCSFCSIGAVYGQRWNALLPHQVVEGMEQLARLCNADAIHFFDNNFFADPQRAAALGSAILDRNLKIKWDGTAVVEQFLNFSPEYILHLKQSGFYRVIVGVESGDEQVLKKIGKRHDNAQVIEMVKKCAQLDIMASMSFMVGFPWKPEKDLVETIGLIEKIKEINPKTEILLFVFSPYLGTRLFDVSLEYGMTFPQSLEGWADYTYDKINTPWITERLKRKINRYISFFGTKDISNEMKNFVLGGLNSGDLAS